MVKINNHEVKSEWKDVVTKLLAYANERVLSTTSIRWGWSIKAHGRPIFQIQVEGREVGVVPQLRWVRTWAPARAINELSGDLRDLISVNNPEFPVIALTKLEDERNFTQFVTAFDRFLEQSDPG